MMDGSNVNNMLKKLLDISSRKLTTIITPPPPPGSDAFRV